MAGGPVGEAGVLFNIERLLSKMDELKLQVTSGLSASSQLREFRDELALGAQDATLSDEQAKALGELMNAMRPTIDSELCTFSAFIVADKRWHVDKLLGAVGELFRPNVFDSLPEMAQIDFEEAGRCIAFECSTAAAFHLLRGTESVLRACYASFVKQKRLPIEKRMWGPMVEQMRRRRRRPPAPLLDNLDNIRRNYRNPTQHPELVYDIHQTQDLLGLCIDVVNQMSQAAP